MRRSCTASLVLLTCLLGCQRPAPSGPESIEMLAVLLSPCVKQEQITGPKNLLPVRYIYSLIRRDGDKASVQYREFDASCRAVSVGAGQWTAEQFGDVEKRFRRAGIKTGQLVIPNEEGSLDFPVSFLKLHTSEYNFDFYTMYLRFRWSGEMKIEDPVIAKALDEWQRLLREATPAVQKKSGIEEILKIADNCGKDWPPSLSSWVCGEAREVTHQQRADETVK